MATSSEPILCMTDIDKHFPGVIALTKARLTVRPGEVMALMGANGAGKSTLMNVLGGVISPNGGTIELSGATVAFQSPRDSKAAGIAFVHQELTMFGTMTVAENIFIDDFPMANQLTDTRRMRAEAIRLLDLVGARIEPDMPVEQLGTGDRQLIEIARALRRNPKVIIFDEPTSSLTDRERHRLFEVVRSLRQAGAAVIYITHFLDEIFAVCDRVTVMRDGTTVSDNAIAEVTAADVVRLMLGPTEEAGRLRPPTPSSASALVEVSGLSRSGALRDVALSLRPGEIVGLWGLLGSGRTELIRALMGLDPIDDGRITWFGDGQGRSVTPTELCGFAGLVTEDRRGEGIVAPQSITDNVALPNLGHLSSALGVIDGRRAEKLACETMNRLSVKASGPQQAIGTLSGGNQQKVVLGRWLAVQPRLFLLDEPTRGLDVSAKTDILKLVVELAQSGCAVLFVSSELGELMRVADRYLVMSRGQIIDDLPPTASEDDLMRAVA